MLSGSRRLVLAVSALAAAIGLGLSGCAPSAAPAPSTPASAAPSTPGTPSDGVEYTSDDFGYAVTFPGRPSESSQNLPVNGTDVTLVTVLWSDADGGLVANAASFPDELAADVEAALDRSVDGAVANVQGAALVSSTPTTLAGLTARDAVATSPAGDLHMIIAFDGGIQYQLLAANIDDATADAFFASFRLVG